MPHHRVCALQPLKTACSAGRAWQWQIPHDEMKTLPAATETQCSQINLKTKLYFRTIMISFTFFIMLTLAVRMEKQWWLKPLVPQHRSRWRYQAVLVVIVFFPHCILSLHIHCKKKKIQSLSVLKEAVKIILLTLSIHIFFNILCDKNGRYKVLLLSVEVWCLKIKALVRLHYKNTWDYVINKYIFCGIQLLLRRTDTPADYSGLGLMNILKMKERRLLYIKENNWQCCQK